MKQQICNCHKFHTGPCPYVLGTIMVNGVEYMKVIDSDNLRQRDREEYLESDLKECDNEEDYKLASDPIGSVWFNGIEYVPKKPSILQQIKEQIKHLMGQVGCDQS